MKSILTFSGLNTFRCCPRKYELRYLQGLTTREKPETLTFGSAIHEALQQWYTLPNDAKRLGTVLDYLDAQFPGRKGDLQVKGQWQRARALFCGYAHRYAQEEFEVVAIEREFEAEIRNPDTGRASQTFTVAGKVDGIVRVGKELYLLEHKTAATLDGSYLDKLWTDTQIALYSYYLRQIGFPIVGVIYNVLLKTRLQQRAGETEAEYEARVQVLAAKNKSGKSNAKRELPETDEEFEARLAEWYSRPEAFHREQIYLSQDRLAMLQDEIWEISQQFLDARRRGKWLLNTAHCFAWSRPCEYLAYCQSGFNPNVRDNLFISKPPHEELSLASKSSETAF
ncbi:MAG: PD-(D/E)XK nuclease family protein [Planctomycetes bacterium]|nr:PD-(D/E)XK nuclease family protein [Planctomycetota bacterium]